MSLFEPSTVVMVATLNQTININNASELLPVVHPKNEQGNRIFVCAKSRRRIPYYGTDGIIVTVRYNHKDRGVRQGGGQMGSMISIDLQTCSKNMNLKLSQKKIQLTGAKSEAMGIRGFELLCSYLEMVQTNLDYISTLSEKVKSETVDWFIEAIKNEEFDSFINDKKDEFITDWTILPFPIEPIIVPKGVDIRMVLFLWTYAVDCDYHTQCMIRIKKVLTITYVCSIPCNIESFYVSNAVYNYSLKRSVPLIHCAYFLRENGIHATFHNWSSNSLKICITVDKPAPLEDIADSTESESEETSDDKIKLHRFTVSNAGTVKQTSPTLFDEAKDKKDIIMEAMTKFFKLLDSGELPEIPVG
jgi:hypothetical protein